MVFARFVLQLLWIRDRIELKSNMRRPNPKFCVFTRGNRIWLSIGNKICHLDWPLLCVISSNSEALRPLRQTSRPRPKESVCDQKCSPKNLISAICVRISEISLLRKNALERAPPRTRKRQCLFACLTCAAMSTLAELVLLF